MNYVAYQLAEMSEAKGDKTAAVGFYGIFLEKTHPKDNRIPFVKAKIAELEGRNQ